MQGVAGEPGPWKGCWEGWIQPILTLLPPPGTHVWLPLPHPLPWQFLHHPAGRAPEIPQSAAQKQERLRLGLLPTSLKGLLNPMCCLRGWGLPCPGRSLLLSLGSVGSVGPEGYTGEDPGLCPSLWGAGGRGHNKGREARRWLEVCGLLRVRQGHGGSVLPQPSFFGLLNRSLWCLSLADPDLEAPDLFKGHQANTENRTLFQGPEVI